MRDFNKPRFGKEPTKKLLGLKKNLIQQKAES
jgi:hypothetical protein